MYVSAHSESHFSICVYVFYDKWESYSQHLHTLKKVKLLIFRSKTRNIYQLY